MKRRYALLVLFAMLSISLFVVSCSQSGGDTSGGTNIQEEGIDEGDIAKFVDGKIYKMQSDGFTVTSVKEDGTAELTAKVPLIIDNPIGLYISNGKLIVIYETETTATESNGSAVICSLEIYSMESITAAPLYSLRFWGSYVESRIDTYREKVLIAYKIPKAKVVKERKSGTEIKYVDSDIEFKVNEEKFKLNEVEELNTEEDDVSQTSVFMSIDLGTNYSYGIKAVRGYALKTLYVSEHGFYPVFCYWKQEGGNCSTRLIEQTIIAKIEVSSLRITAQRLLEDFTIESRHSLYDTGENLYIAAEQSSKEVIVLLSFDDKLNLVGSLTEICENEVLKSVSYALYGETTYCYIVTYFEQYSYDPLFKIDISDPKNMKLKGYLTIDGYSDYTYAFDAQNVVGVGDDGNGGVQVSLFNLENDKPKLKTRYITDSSVTPVMDDSRAFCVNREEGIFGIPVSSITSNRNAMRQGMYFYRLNEIGELEQLQFVSDIETSVNAQEPFWFYSNEDMSMFYVLRAFYSDEYIYTVSERYVTVYSKEGILDGNALVLYRLAT